MILDDFKINYDKTGSRDLLNWPGDTRMYILKGRESENSRPIVCSHNSNFTNNRLHKTFCRIQFLYIHKVSDNNQFGLRNWFLCFWCLEANPGRWIGADVREVVQDPRRETCPILTESFYIIMPLRSWLTFITRVKTFYDNTTFIFISLFFVFSLQLNQILKRTDSSTNYASRQKR